MHLCELAAARYSVRKFQAKPVEPEKLDAILECARLAPTARNNQPQRVKVLTAPDDLAKVDQCTPCRFGAPAVLMVCCDTAAAWKRPFDGATSAEVDAAIVTTYLMLAAWEQGLGSCWVMHFDPAKAREAFALPDNLMPVALLPIGCAAEDAAPSERHAQRIALEQMLI